MEILSKWQRHFVSERFTLDGSDALEERIALLCDTAYEGVQDIVRNGKLEAIVLGGGYGRGQGGVLKTDSGDAPYNDLEFYVFVRGNRHWNRRAFSGKLDALGERLSIDAGLHVEFKVDSLAHLRRSRVSMFSYDLVSGHRLIFQSSAAQLNRSESDSLQCNPRMPGGNFRRPIETANWLFAGCEHHLDARSIPLSEATRLLFNRCTGLLLVKELLAKDKLSPEQSDFTGRNLAKAQLALGDAVLVAAGQYNWNCVERHERLERLTRVDGLSVLPDLRQHHALGMEFKLHPERLWKTPEQFAAEHREISGLAERVWLWLEGRRLKHLFASARDYAFSSMEKCPGVSRRRSVVLNLRTFRARIPFDRTLFRYPRERLLHSLALLLWDETAIKDLKAQRHLQNQLRTTASDWPGLVAAYKAVWPNLG